MEYTEGLILIAAAPDFTEDSMQASFTEAQKQEIAEQGVTYIPSDYGDPYPISNHLLSDSRRAFVSHLKPGCHHLNNLSRGPICDTNY